MSKGAIKLQLFDNYFKTEENFNEFILKLKEKIICAFRINKSHLFFNSQIIWSPSFELWHILHSNNLFSSFKAFISFWRFNTFVVSKIF